MMPKDDNKKKYQMKILYFRYNSNHIIFKFGCIVYLSLMIMTIGDRVFQYLFYKLNYCRYDEMNTII